MSFPWEMVDKNSDGDCWELKSKNWRYARVGYGERWMLAHRAAYLDKVGDIGDKLVLHECDNTECVNPEHLYLGTQSDNMQDMWDRERRSRDYSDHTNAKLTKEMVCEIRQRCENGESQVDLAEEYPCSRSLIGQVYRREAWKHVKC